MVELFPIAIDESLAVQPMATLRAGYDHIASILGQPFWRDLPDFPGDPLTSRVMWRVRDTITGAYLVIWDDNSDADTPADTTVWRVWWRDGDGHVGSGEKLLDVTVGKETGGEVEGQSPELPRAVVPAGQAMNSL